MKNAIATGDFGGMEASLREFCDRPENKHIINKQQHKQAKRALQLKKQYDAMQFRDKVLEADVEAQQNIAPFLRHKVLRDVVESFTNSPCNAFESWAKNQQVIDMLKEAQRLLDNGYITEQELENSLLAQLQSQFSESSVAVNNGTLGNFKIGSDQLVLALNQHLMERRQGNQHYRQRDFAAALVHYNNAILILEPLKGCAAEYQEEIDTNLVKAYLNIAALHLAKQYYGQAIAWCTKALTKDQQNKKALLRRAKAHVGRHNYQNAIADLSTLVQQDPSNLEAHAMLQDTRAEEYAERCT